MNANLRKVVILAAGLNLSYFGVEFAVALAIDSVSLFADSIDFSEDASVNFLIAIALGWSATNRARVGLALTGILLHTRPRYAMDRVEEVLGANAARSASPVAGWWRCPRHQSIVRAHAGAVPGAKWHPEASSVLVSLK